MADDEQQTEEAPFDENPPVDPSKPQVGNSKAQFVMPEESDEEGEGEGEAAREGHEGEPRE